MNDPKCLDTLDLEDFSDHYAKTKNLYNYIYVLNFIKEELSKPFEDIRKKKQ